MRLRLFLLLAACLSRLASAGDYIGTFSAPLPGAPVAVESGSHCFGVTGTPILYTTKFYSSDGYLGEEQQLSPTAETISRDVAVTKDLTFVEAQVFDLLGALVETHRWTIIYIPTFPGSFALQSPTDGQSYDPPNTPTVLEWEPAEDASEYEVYLERGDSTPDVKVATVTSNRWHHGSGMARGTWYWKVVAVNSDGSTESSTKSFELKDHPPGAFGNVSPANMSSRPEAFPSISLTWGASARAETYDVYLQRENSNPTTRFGSVNADRTSFSAQRSLEAGVWYWRVIARNPWGSYAGPVSSFRVFGVPQPVPLVYPPNNARYTLPAVPLFLRWSTVPDATSYDVLLKAPEAGHFTTVLSDTTESEWEIDVSLGEGTWEWMVRAKNTNGSASSTPSHFQIIRNPLGAMTIELPLDGTHFQLPSQPTRLDWSDSSNATSYEIYLAKGSGVPETRVGTSVNSHWTPDFQLDEGLWSWRVKATDAPNSRWSPLASFVIGPPLPGTPTLHSPARNTTFSMDQQPLRFDWSDASNATSYRVHLGQSLPLAEAATVSISEWEPDEDLTAGDWMWRVVAVNDSGETESELRGLTILPPLSGYELWLSEYPAIPPSKRGKSDDPDGDGVANILERFFASSPVDPGESGNVHWLNSGGSPRLRFHRRKGYENSDGWISWSSDLRNWFLDGESDGSRSVSLPMTVADSAHPDYDLIELTPSSSQTLPKIFIRINAE